MSAAPTRAHELELFVVPRRPRLYAWRVTGSPEAFQESVLEGQVRLIHRSGTAGALGSISAAVFLVIASTHFEVPLVRLAPLAVVALLYVGRLVTHHDFERAPRSRTASAWRRRAILSNGAAGIAWGVSAVLIMPVAPTELRLLQLIIAAGLVAAAVSTLASVREAYVALAVPALLGMVLGVVAAFGSSGLALAGLLLVFLAVMLRASRSLSETVRQTLALSLEKQELATRLAEANEAAEAARHRAEQASRAKSEFLARMSHEIRTPMNGILGVTELLLTNHPTAEERRLLEASHHSGRALLSIIDDILDFSKLEAGKVTLVREPFCLEDLLEDLMALFAVAAGRKGLLLAYDVSPEVPGVVVGDDLRLRQVMTNLLGNALKFTSEGKVVLSATMRAGRLRLAVRDTGIGIPEAVQARLFSSFEQADPSVARRFGGTGLGLAISQQLVRLMGGTLGVQSQPGRGSEFAFELPLAGALSGDDATAPGPGAGRRALVVEGHPLQARNLTRWLSHAGFEVVEGGAEPSLAGVDLLVVDEPAWRRLAPGRPASLAVLLCDRRLQDPGGPADAPGVARVSAPLRRRAVIDAVTALLGDRAAPVTRLLPAAGTYSHLRVLVADDDAINRTVATAMLRRLGCTPVVVDGGRAALTALRSSSWDVVLLDCEMPEVDGFTVARERRADEAAGRLARLPVIALTAHASESHRAQCLEAGMDEMVTKPVSIDRLRTCLEQWAPRPLARAANEAH